MRRLVVSGLLLLSSGACGRDDRAAPGPVPSLPPTLTPSAGQRCALPQRISGAEARRLLEEGALLLDVRPRLEFAQSHLPDAVNIPLEELSSRMSELPIERTIITYCKLGDRSHKAAELLREAGYDVHELGGRADFVTVEC